MASVDPLRGRITTALDVLALLLIAAGVAFGLWPLVGGVALIPAGVLIAAGSLYGDREKAA